MEKGKIYRTKTGDLTVVHSAKDHGTFKAATVVGPPKWSYEGLDPHLYVIQYYGMFYAFWDDGDTCYLLDWVMGMSDLADTSSLVDKRYDGLLDQISKAFEGGEHINPGYAAAWEKAIMGGSIEPWEDEDVSKLPRYSRDWMTIT